MFGGLVGPTWVVAAWVCKVVDVCLRGLAPGWQVCWPPCLVGRPTGPPAGWLGWLVGWPASWSAGRWAGQLGCHRPDQPDFAVVAGRPTGTAVYLAWGAWYSNNQYCAQLAIRLVGPSVVARVVRRPASRVAGWPGLGLANGPAGGQPGGPLVPCTMARQQQCGTDCREAGGRAPESVGALRPWGPLLPSVSYSNCEAPSGSSVRRLHACAANLAGSQSGRPTTVWSVYAMMAYLGASAALPDRFRHIYPLRACVSPHKASRLHSHASWRPWQNTPWLGCRVATGGFHSSVE